MSVIEQFKESSTATKVVAVGLVVAIVGVLLCSCGLLGWAFLASDEPPTDIAELATATPLPPQPTSTRSPDTFQGWRAEYFNNPNLQGEPVLVRDEPSININLQDNSPAAEVPAENFSVRWTVSRDVPAGIYRFTGTFDNGYRLWVDDNLLVDQWSAGPVRTEVTEVNLTAGTHSVIVEYFHTTGPAMAQFKTEPIENYPDWKAEYFAQPNFDSPPMAVQNEPEINYNWGSTSPIPGVIPDNDYAVRWARTAQFEDGNYVFRVDVEGGVRLWMDGQIVIDSWDQQPFRQLENMVPNVNAGGHGLKVEFWKQSGNGQIRVGWAKVQDVDQSPVAVINGTNNAVVGQPVNFNGRSSSVAEGSVLVAYDWDLGDGTTASGVEVTHIYNSPGAYAVTLTVVDDKGLSNSTVHEIKIDAGEVPPTPEPDQPPVAQIAAPGGVQVGETFTVDASGSQCANKCISYAWDMGDGTQANAIALEHAYQSVGVFNVILTVTDDKGLQGTTNHSITVEQGEPEATDTPETPAEPPTAAITGPADGAVGELLRFDGSSSQPGGGGPIVRYEWDFGDGGSDSSGPVVEYAYNGEGNFVVTLTVKDEQGATGETEWPIEITPPSGEQLPVETVEAPEVEPQN